MHRSFRVGALAAALWTAPYLTLPAAALDPPAPEIYWQTEYGWAMDLAKQRRRMLLIFFYDPHNNTRSDSFEQKTLADPEVSRKMQNFVCLRLPLEAKISVDGKTQTVLKNKAFKEMLGKPGVAVLDFAHPDAKTYGCAVSTFPLTDRLHYGPQKMRVILDLPPGTLTQRTLIYAVRTHPDRPASTDGEIDTNLLKEAESHSEHQARIRRQGHHRWAARFPRINALLPRGLTAREVCAESWPGENLVEAAIECVNCWRSSSGHWSAVRARQGRYGYDMKRGRNGIWYATGILGGR